MSSAIREAIRYAREKDIVQCPVGENKFLQLSGICFIIIARLGTQENRRANETNDDFAKRRAFFKGVALFGFALTLIPFMREQGPLRPCERCICKA